MTETALLEQETEQLFKEFFTAPRRDKVDEGICPFCDRKRWKNRSSCYVKLICPKCGVEIMYNPRKVRS